MKALSSLAKVGLALLFVQVYRLSRRGISRTTMSWMALLKDSAREKLKFELFLSSTDLVRLKSPMRTQGPEMRVRSSESSAKKA